MVFSLLRRYLQMYWLKPFDAVNDTANAWALRQCPWSEPILEIGSGDGVFSFILHGGEFSFVDDRYDQADPRLKGDIFDIYHEKSRMAVKRPAQVKYAAGLDLKRSHLMKCKETGMYRLLVVSTPQELPFSSDSFMTVFLYFPHGLVEQGKALDYRATLKEVRRVLHRNGSLLMTAFHKNVSRYFLCNMLSSFFSRRDLNKLGRYFRNLDAGRSQEISHLARSPGEWEKLLFDSGLKVVDVWCQISPIAWLVYDIQTRPIFRQLIKWNWVLRRLRLKRFLKRFFVYACLPILVVFYYLFARPRGTETIQDHGEHVGYVFRAVPSYDPSE